jgi:hypothetical protein
MTWVATVIAIVALVTAVAAYRMGKRIMGFLEEMFTRQFADYTPDKAWSLFWDLVPNAPRRVWLKVASGTCVRLTKRPAGMVCEWIISEFWPLRPGRKVVVHVINVGDIRGVMPLSYRVEVTIQERGVLPQTFDPVAGEARRPIDGPTGMEPHVFAEWAWKIYRARKA